MKLYLRVQEHKEQMRTRHGVRKLAVYAGCMRKIVHHVIKD